MATLINDQLMDVRVNVHDPAWTVMKGNGNLLAGTRYSVTLGSRNPALFLNCYNAIEWYQARLLCNEPDMRWVCMVFTCPVRA